MSGEIELKNAPPLFGRPMFREQSFDGPYPQMPRLHAILSVATTVSLLAYAGLFGIYPILLLYALWIPKLVYKKRFIVNVSREIYVPILLISYAVLSTAWSDNPEITAKASIESASMVICSIAIARVTTLDSFLKGIVLGVCVVLVASLIDGTKGVDSFTGTYSLVGLFASKNQLGLHAEIGVYAGLLLLFSRNSLLQKIIFSLIPLVICVPALYMSRSASSSITLFFAFSVCIFAYCIQIFPVRFRKTLIWVGIFFVVLITIVAISFNLMEQGLNIFGKDTTLTGRTLLWADGIKFGLQNPIFGIGYNNFWVPGRPLAEELWFKFDIFNRIGFHFHDTFIQLFVDLGIIGLLLMIIVFVNNCIQSMRSIIYNEASVLGYYCIGFSFMFFLRAFVEFDIGGTFAIGPMIFFSVLPRLSIGALQMKHLGDPNYQKLSPKSLLPSRAKLSGSNGR